MTISRAVALVEMIDENSRKVHVVQMHGQADQQMQVKFREKHDSISFNMHTSHLEISKLLSFVFEELIPFRINIAKKTESCGRH